MSTHHIALYVTTRAIEAEHGHDGLYTINLAQFFEELRPYQIRALESRFLLEVELPYPRVPGLLLEERPSGQSGRRGNMRHL